MIHTTLSHLASSLSDYLKRTFALNEDMVCMQSIPINVSSVTEHKLFLTLVNVERETAQGIRFGGQKSGSGQYIQKTPPPWLVNLYVLFSTAFPEKQYEDALQVLSAVCLYLQSNPVHTLSQTGEEFFVEPVNLSFNELANLWGILGGSYCPSVLCKVRLLTLDALEVKGIQRLIHEKEVSL